MILITGGATVNMIDATRYISSKSNGSTALTLYDKITKYEIYNNIKIECELLLSENTINSIKNYYSTYNLLNCYAFTDNYSLESLLKTKITKYQPDWVIHSASVSDYIPEPESVTTSKISSDQDTLDLHLVKAPKIVDSIKLWAPDTKLVSFKAGDPHTSYEKLKIIARNQLIRTKSHYVWLNRLDNLNKVYLVGSDIIQGPYTRDEALHLLLLEINNQLNNKN